MGNFKPLLGLVLLGYATIAMVGCGRDLLASCEEAQDQNCTSVVNCSDAVNLGGALATNASCESQFDAYDSCATDQSDVCTIEASCKSQIDAFSTCVQPYCVSHLDECQKVATALGIAF